MKAHINDFVVVERQENGQVVVSYDAQCRANIYRYLREIGFCQTKLDNRRVFYRRTGEGIFPVDFEQIEDAFFDRLKDKDFSTIPGVEYNKIFDLFIIENPIRQYKSFYNELRDELDDNEAHEYLLKADPNYRVRNEVEDIQKMLAKYKFTRTIDTAGNFSRMAPIYFKEVSLGTYLVFNHYNVKEKHLYQGFDCWLAEYKLSNMLEDINQKTLISKRQLKANFKLHRDFGLVAKFLEN